MRRPFGVLKVLLVPYLSLEVHHRLISIRGSQSEWAVESFVIIVVNYFIFRQIGHKQ